MLALFRKAKLPISKKRLSDYLDEAMLLLSDDGFRGAAWMTALSAAMWESSGGKSWTDLYQPLAKMLYDVGFIGLIQSGGPVVYSYDKPDFADSPSNLESAEEFAIHSAYHMALGVT